MSKIPTNILKRITSYADMLPHKNNKTGFEQQKISGLDLFLCGHTMVEDEEIDMNKTYIINVPVTHRVNHEERMKDAYKRLGKQGVFEYLEKFIDPKHVNELRREIFTSGNFDVNPSNQTLFRRNINMVSDRIKLLQERISTYKKRNSIKNIDFLKEQHNDFSQKLIDEAQSLIVFIADTKLMEGVTNAMSLEMDPMINTLYNMQKMLGVDLDN